MNVAAELWGTLGDPTGWSEVAPSGGDYTFHAGQPYAVLASVSKDESLTKITQYMTSNGWTVSYAWEWGTPLRSPPGPIDTWLAALTADPTDNHRWVYGEATRPAGDWTKGQSAPWPLTIYEIAHVFALVPLPPGAAAPPPLPPAGAQALPVAVASPLENHAITAASALAVGAGVLLGWFGVRY